MTLNDICFYVKDKRSIDGINASNYVTTDNMVPNKGGITPSEYLPEGNSVDSFQKGDVLLSNIRPYFKKIWLADRDGGCCADVLILRPKGISSELLYAYLSQDIFFDYDTKGAKGSKMPRGDKDHIMRFPIKELKNSNLVGKFTKLIDDKIILNKRTNEELENMAKTIFYYWFTQFDFPDKNGHPYKSSGGQMVYNEPLKREIPSTWNVEYLENCVQTIIDHRGVTPKKLGGDWVENGIIALSAKIVKNNKLINLDEANQVSEEMYKKWMPEELVEGDILMTSEAPLGEFYFLVGKTKYCLSQRLFAIRANKEKLLPSYLFNELSHGNGYSQIQGKQSGSTVFGIRQDELKKVLVLIPEMTLQLQYENLAMNLYSRIRKNDEENESLTKLRDYLLPLLMNGQITIRE